MMPKKTRCNAQIMQSNQITVLAAALLCDADADVFPQALLTISF